MPSRRHKLRRLDSQPRPLNSPPRLNLIDRYIFKSVLFTCAAAVGLFAFVLILGNALKDLLGYVLAGQISLMTLARLTALLIPYVIIYALPMGILTGVLLTLGRLSADSEITALRACGLSLARIARPVLMLGTLGLALGLYVNFDFMPRARVQYHRELAQAIRTNPLSFIVPKTFVRDFSGVVAYIGEREGAILRDVWVWKLDDEKRVTQFIHGSSGRIDFDETTNELILTLTLAKVETRDLKHPEVFSTAEPLASFQQTEPVRFSLHRLFGQRSSRNKPEWLTWTELEREQAKLASKQVPPAEARQHELAQMRLKLVVQEKFTTALSILSFALIGVPLGIKVSRRETSANLGLALVLVLGYYFLTVMVKWLDRHPEYRPDLLMWVPNILFIALAVWLFSRVERK